MSKSNHEKREQAYEIYEKFKGKITCKDIAEQLNLKPDTVVKWKNRFNWDRLVGNGPGAPLGNQNAKGHDGGRQRQVFNRVIDGKYISLLPESVGKMLKKIQCDDPAEKLWRAIGIQEQRIIGILNHMHVDEHTEDDRIVIKDSAKGTEYRHVFVWEKMAAQQDALGKAYKILMQLIKQHDDYVHKNWEDCNYEQRMRVDQMKAKLDHRIKMDTQRLELERQKFEHKKALDEQNSWWNDG